MYIQSVFFYPNQHVEYVYTVCIFFTQVNMIQAPHDAYTLGGGGGGVKPTPHSNVSFYFIWYIHMIAKQFLKNTKCRNTIVSLSFTNKCKNNKCIKL